MEILLPWADPAYSTELTVILLLILVKQVAYITVILPKLHITLLTSLLCLLHCLAVRALHLCDLEAVHLMILLCIMAQSTHIQFATARCFQ